MKQNINFQDTEDIDTFEYYLGSLTDPWKLVELLEKRLKALGIYRIDRIFDSIDRKSRAGSSFDSDEFLNCLRKKSKDKSRIRSDNFKDTCSFAFTAQMWRQNQRIFKFDDDWVRTLVNAPIPEDLNTECLTESLPFPSTYVSWDIPLEIEGRQGSIRAVNGVFFVKFRENGAEYVQVIYAAKERDALTTNVFFVPILPGVGLKALLNTLGESPSIDRGLFNLLFYLGSKNPDIQPSSSLAEDGTYSYRVGFRASRNEQYNFETVVYPSVKQLKAEAALIYKDRKGKKKGRVARG